MHPYILLIIAMIFFSGNIIVGKLFVGIIPPFTLSLLRTMMAFIILFPICYKQVLENKELWLKEWKPLLLISVTGLVLFNACLYLSVNYTTTINVSIVDALTPAMAALLGFIVLKERLTSIQWFGIVLSFVSICFIIFEGSISVLLSLSVNSGDLIMLLGIAFWAVYSLLIKIHGKKFPVIAGLVVTMLLSSVILLPLSLVEFAQHGNVFSGLSWLSYIGLSYIGIFPSAIALLLWYHAVAEVGPSKASIFFNLVPIFTSVLAILFLGETFTLVHFFGGIFVLLGVYLSTKAENENKNKNERQLKVSSY